MNTGWKENIKIPLVVLGVIMFLYFFKYLQNYYGTHNF